MATARPPWMASSFAMDTVSAATSSTVETFSATASSAMDAASTTTSSAVDAASPLSHPPWTQPRPRVRSPWIKPRPRPRPPPRARPPWTRPWPRLSPPRWTRRCLHQLRSCQRPSTTTFTDLVGAPGRRTPGPRPGAVGILRVGTAELVHEVGDHAVEVEAVVKPGLGQVDEVGSRDGHLVEVEFGLKGPFRGVEDGGGVRHLDCEAASDSDE